MQMFEFGPWTQKFRADLTNLHKQSAELVPHRGSTFLKQSKAPMCFDRDFQNKLKDLHVKEYRGTWLIRNSPPLGPYSKLMARVFSGG